jgi:Amt family ammonium transporter
MGNFIGGFGQAFMNGVDANSLWPSVGEIGGQPTAIPTLVFAAFQMMFALITPAIITGSLAGRMKFKALFGFIAIWSVIVYYPMAHMVWGGGILGPNGLDSIDFAGGNVVHIASGVSGLVLCILLGKRHGYEQKSYRTHNIPFVMLGMALLWFGWFAFNAGSAGGANGLAGHAFFTTALSAATGMLSWLLIDVIVSKKPTLIGACTGAVAGLVGITPGAGFVPVYAAFIIGALVSPICYGGIYLIKKKLKLDDALDAFGCHGIGGIFGGLMAGIFAKQSVNGYDGLLYGNAGLLGNQAIAVLISALVAAVGTLIAAGIVRIFTKLRVEKKDELVGLDISEHGESAYPSFNGLD